MRTSYTGVGRDIFPNDEAVYNPNTEKISSLGINKNQIRQPIEIVLGNARSDNTTQRIKVTGNITDPGYSVQYEKKYRINGREMKQSMKKANEKKIAKDR